MTVAEETSLRGDEERITFFEAGAILPLWSEYDRQRTVRSILTMIEDLRSGGGDVDHFVTHTQHKQSAGVDCLVS